MYAFEISTVAATVTLDTTAAAAKLAADAGLTTEQLEVAAREAIATTWVNVCDTWGETAWYYYSANLKRFVNFAARFGGPDGEPLDRVVVMTIDEFRA